MFRDCVVLRFVSVTHVAGCQPSHVARWTEALVSSGEEEVVVRGRSAAVLMISAVQEGLVVQIHVAVNANKTAKVECFCIFEEAAPIFFTLMCNNVKEVTGSEETTPPEQLNTKKTRITTL